MLAGVARIVSGGQVGADRAGLDFAIEQGIPHGGWCPLGRAAQDGIVPLKYQLVEADMPGYPYRTRLNVRDSDGTVVFTGQKPGRGSALTINTCIELGKPYLVLGCQDQLHKMAVELTRFLTKHKIKTLNVAGSRSDVYYKMALLTLRFAATEEGLQDG